MSTSISVRESPTPCRSLGVYVAALVDRLGEAEPTLLARLREVVGARRARITLDQESVDVHFEAGGLVVAATTDAEVDGEGSTDRSTTLDLLDGRLEVTDAILEGRLRAIGEVESIAR
ncbi:MAG: SCP2 sterol-binding domain-containing protein, partial [Gemmatimonadota bacterium]